MAVNKVIYDGNTLVDLTGDSVTPQTLAKGVTAHTANGEPITGLLPVASITNVTESNADGGANVVTFSDGTKLEVKNGNTGSRGTSILNVTTAPSSYTTATGGFTPKYRIALSTVKTQSGVSSVIVGDSLRYSYYVYPVGYVDSSYVYCGTRVSIRGATGAAGANGTTPVKGTDYFTESDKAEIVARVVAQIKDGGVIGYVDSNNNIVLSGNLSDGTYSIKYEIEDGSTLDVGNLVIGEVEEEIINQIRNSVNADGTPYGTNGYKSDTRIDSSTGNEATVAGHCATGFIPVTSADKVYIKEITYTDADKPRFAVYDSSKTKLASSSFAATGYGWASESNGVWTIDVKVLKSSGVAFFRFSAIGFTDETIITINQPLS